MCMTPDQHKEMAKLRNLFIDNAACNFSRKIMNDPKRSENEPKCDYCLPVQTSTGVEYLLCRSHQADQFRKRAEEIARNVKFTPREDFHIFAGEIERALRETWNEAIEKAAYVGGGHRQCTADWDDKECCCEVRRNILALKPEEK